MAKFNSPLTVLRASFTSLKKHPQTLQPLVLISFLNLLALEILYFAPRYPLSIVFDPFIRRIWGEKFLHYPMDLVLLPKTFYYAQILIGLFISNVLFATIAYMLAAYNNEERVNFSQALRKCLGSYIHIVTTSVIALGLFIGASWLYGFVIASADKIQAAEGFMFFVKNAVILGAPYAQLVFDIFISILLMYVIPIIVIEKKKVFQAAAANCKVLLGSFWMSAVLVVIPTLFYFPILIMRNNIGFLADITMPGIQVIVIAIGILASTAINGIILAAATTYYLFWKEDR